MQVMGVSRALSEDLQDAESRSRQDQILLLAAEGMTDKEIAARLNLSPETVGTYWRRILSKYSAASRTEVVAKVVRLQAEASVGEIEEVNQCLREVADHLLVVLANREESETVELRGIEADVLEQLVTPVLLLDERGFLTYFSRPIDGVALSLGDPFEWCVSETSRPSVRDALERAYDGSASAITLSLKGSVPLPFSAQISCLERRNPRQILVQLMPLAVSLA